MKVWATKVLAWLNKARNVVFHAAYGVVGAGALLLDQLKLVDWSSISAAKAGTIAAVISVGAILLHFTDERIKGQ
jgi:hypothetical protein